MSDAPIEVRLASLQTRAFLAGAIGLALCVLGAFLDARQFFISYLFAYLFWLGLSLGCFGFLMIHHLAGGRWGFPVRRFYEAAISTLPLMAVLFLPICFGLRYLYIWTDPHAVAVAPVLQHRSGYMTPVAFIARSFLFLLLWAGAAILFNGYSLAQDRTTDTAPTRALRTLSGPGMLLYPLTATFAFVDWILSLEPDWSSTMFLVLIVIGQMLAGLAFSILLLAWLHKSPPLADKVTSVHFHHLGMLLFAFIMLWTYMAFSQFLIIYSGNLPREIIWYAHRVNGGWKSIVWILFLCHFLIPFSLLLSRTLKKSAPALATIAATIFLVHMLDTYWLVEPSFFPAGIHFHWLDLAAPLGLGGVWLGAFARRLALHPLLVRNDPREYETTR